MAEFSARGLPVPFSHPFFGLGGFPYFRLQKKVGTLILTSLLEDLVRKGYPQKDTRRETGLQ